MAFQLSPGVNVSEIDLTTVVPAVASSDGAFAGVFRWGPVGERILIDSENNLVSRFGKPTNYNSETFFTAANFLSYANRLYVSRAANTSGSTPYVTFAANTSTNTFIGDTTNISVGMYVTQTSNATVRAAGENVTVLSKNSSSIVLSHNPSVNGSVTLYFGRPETSYTAVGFDSSNSSVKVANLVNQIVKNENDYTNKDGNFDSDILYVAKYPGKTGNSLRIGVCDTAAAFNSTISVSNSTVNSLMQFTVGSANAVVKFPGSNSSFVANIQSTFQNGITIGDQVLAGNSSIGQQYLQLKEILVSVTNNEVIVIDGNTAINTNANFITVANNNLVDGDILYYANAAGNSEISGLTRNVNYFVVGANSSGFKLSTTAFGEEVDIAATANAEGSFSSNSTNVTLTFEDPYRLRTNYHTNTVNRYWEFFNVVDSAPGQSDYVLLNGNTSANDELHVVVVDDGGEFSGTPGTILEVYRGLSRATDAKNVDGSDNYYKNVINKDSNYIWWAADRPAAVSNTAMNLINASSVNPLNVDLVLGSDGHDESSVSLGTLGQAYDLFASAEDIDISLVLQGKPVGGTTVVNGTTVQNFQLANYLIENIAEVRKDCIVLLSPDRDTVLNNTGNEATSLRAWRGAITSSSYAVMDSGYKYQYDRYNDVYRWVPLNGDIAGTCVRTDNTNDAWWSPAGFNRGQIKNLVKLAWNPRKSERDVLYSNGINPVVTFPGQGTVLFGDKTLQAKPSAFDRINVRRLFIVLEKAISTAAKYSLFEFNDAFTRAQFKNLVTPYLRTIKGRRGITDFLVVCDDTNNTAQVIDSNQFVGDIYIKPARSINFIQLNFVAVPSGVQFSEVVGKF